MTKETIDTKCIDEVLQKIQSSLIAPKNDYNKYGDYNYRSAEGILAALKPILKELGAAVTLSDQITEVAGRAYITSTATLRWKGQTISTSASACEPSIPCRGRDASQSTGATSSYARKYALGGLLALDGNKFIDPDASNRHGTDSRIDEASVRLINKSIGTDELVKVCKNMVEKEKINRADVVSVYKSKLASIKNSEIKCA